MRDFFVYCAGPITGLAYNDSVDWRKYVAKKFPDNIKVLSPMRFKEYLIDEKEIKNVYENPLSASKGIVLRDRNDVKRSDGVLVNLLGAEKVSIGSVGEIFWADAFRKPVVIVMEKDNIHRHGMIEELGLILPDLDEAIETMKQIILP